MQTWKLISAIAALTVATSAQANSFGDYQCLDDCSGHQAGFDWAEQNQIDDEASCSTFSTSFNEGCVSFVQGTASAVDDDDDDDDDDDE